MQSHTKFHNLFPMGLVLVAIVACGETAQLTKIERAYPDASIAPDADQAMPDAGTMKLSYLDASVVYPDASIMLDAAKPDAPSLGDADTSTQPDDCLHRPCPMTVRRLIPDMDYAAGLDVRNGHIAWVQVPDRGPGRWQCAYCFWHERVWAASASNPTPRLVGDNGAGPSVNERGQIGFGQIRLYPDYCVEFYQDGVHIGNNCAGTHHPLGQCTSTVYQGNLFAYFMRRNEGASDSHAEEYQLWVSDGQSTTMVHARAAYFGGRPRMHNGTIGAINEDHAGALLYSGTPTQRHYRQLDCPGGSCYSFDFGQTWAAFADNVQVRFVRLAGGQVLERSFPGFGVTFNDEESLALIQQDGGFRYLPIDSRGPGELSIFIAGREAVLDGRDIYYIAPDTTGHDALFVISGL